MKATLLIVFTFSMFSFTASSQDLAYDQNPNYQLSREKYMKVADSVNKLHSTTLQETYKAIDYMQAKEEARQQRREYRQQRRLYADRYGYDRYDYDRYYHDRGRYYYPSSSRYNRYNYRYRPYRTFGHDQFWGSLPWAVTLGLLCR